jgi:hypothetical protein
VPLVCRTMDRRALTTLAGELSTVGNGGTAVYFPNSCGRALLFPPPSNPNRSSWDQRLKKLNTPSGSILLKKPLVSFYFHPQSLIQKDNSDFDLF